MNSAAALAKSDTAPRDTLESANRAARKAVDQVNTPTFSSGFSKFSNRVAHATGKPITFAIAFLVILVWAVTGPIFNYSDTWQLIINTGTTIVTFLMVFLIQNTQNRDGAALQAKLDELIRATQDARDAYMGIEKLDEPEVEKMREECGETARAEGAETARRETTTA
ncbi:MAG TPA: low affinity iron permease family protein [Alphaproteobacteria bacterium]|jgi:low affinity Fe/Cu permease|nr:low affinity iron permease family protein [Alphaproteobacteria bacterium]